MHIISKSPLPGIGAVKPASMNKHTPIPEGFIKHPVHFFALGFGSGFVPKLPGTAGTVAGVIIYLPLQYLQINFYLCVVFILFLSGIWICDLTARHLGVHDHSAIVWDEFVGYLITMIAAPAGWMWIPIGFVLFRIFDIWKPWPISVIDNKVTGGLGIMLDDGIAAIFALCVLQIMSYLL